MARAPRNANAACPYAPRELMQTELEARFYDRSRGWVDGTTEFHNLIRSCVKPNATLLEIGAGPTNPTSEFLSTLGTLTGIDPDADVMTNRFLSHAFTMQGERFPLENQAYDLCVSDYVAEHLPDPVTHLREVYRVLKPGGCYLFRTPNFTHYVTLISAATPHWFHKRVANRARGLPAEAHDPYPVHYLINSSRRVKALAEDAGFRIESLRMVEKEPSYGRFAKAAFYAGLVYERLVNRFDQLASFRSNMQVVLRKPA